MKNLILTLAFFAVIGVHAQSLSGNYFTTDGSMCTIKDTGNGIELSVYGVGTMYFGACGQTGNILSFCNYSAGVLTTYVMLDGQLGVWSIVGGSSIYFAKMDSGITRADLQQLQQQQYFSPNYSNEYNNQTTKPCAAIRAEIKQLERRIRNTEKTQREAEERIDQGWGYGTNTSIITNCINLIYKYEAQINELTQQLNNCSGY